MINYLVFVSSLILTNYNLRYVLFVINVYINIQYMKHYCYEEKILDEYYLKSSIFFMIT